MFPPTGGLSVVMWFCVDCFATSESIRLIDITRHLAKPQDSLTCLSVHILVDPTGNIKLLISTREHNSAENPDAEASSDTVLVDMNVLKEQESVWHCLVVSLVSTQVLQIDRNTCGSYRTRQFKCGQHCSHTVIHCYGRTVVPLIVSKH